MSRRLIAAAALAAAAPAALLASERHFTYVYESAVLPQNAKEIEIWSTWRRGKDGQFFSAMDNRAEFEIGVTDTVQAALYLNFSSESVEDPATGEIAKDSSVDGFSLELKKKFRDAAADPIGLAGYVELGVASDEAEIEFKAIADKLVGKNLLAGNLTYEPEFEYEAHSNVVEHIVEATLAYGYLISPAFSIGLEAREQNIWVADEGGFLSATLFVGPAVHLAWGDFWVTGTWLPQLTAFKGETGDTGLDLDEHERNEFRLIGGIHF